jgi:hypothetical protein
MTKLHSEIRQDRDAQESLDLLDQFIIGWYEANEEARRRAFSIVWSYLHRN